LIFISIIEELWGDLLLIKTDANGNELWNKTYGASGLSFDWGNSVVETATGGFIIAGVKNAMGLPPDAEGWLIKTDANGNKLWDKTFGGIGSDSFNSVSHTKDGGYIMTGYTKSFGVNLSDVWLIKSHPLSQKQQKEKQVLLSGFSPHGYKSLDLTIS
jgi:hypothetical protein